MSEIGNVALYLETILKYNKVKVKGMQNIILFLLIKKTLAKLKRIPIFFHEVGNAPQQNVI